MIISKFPAYDVTEDGVVTEVATGKVVPHKVHSLKCRNYPTVLLKRPDKTFRTYSVVRLVAEAFMPEHNETDVAILKDDDWTNITVSNIEWMSRKDIARRSANKKQKRKKASYTPELGNIIIDVLSLYYDPVSVTQLSFDLGMPYSTVRYAVNRLVDEKRVLRSKDGVVVLR